MIAEKIIKEAGKKYRSTDWWTNSLMNELMNVQDKDISESGTGYIKPGDLVFFGRPISHVGIYLGGGKMVHAPRSGSRVKVASASSLGRKPYVGARRL